MGYGLPLSPAKAWQLLQHAGADGEVRVRRATFAIDAFQLVHLVRRRADVHRLHVLDRFADEVSSNLVAGGELAARTNGFAPRTTVQGANTTVQTNEAGLAVDEAQVRALDRLVVRLRASGVTPVLAAMGTSTRWDSTPRGAQLTKDEGAALTRLAARRDVQLIDLRSIKDPNLFIDLVHTNGDGSHAETEMLVDQLRSGCGT